MNVVGCLIWYDESPSVLATAVAGFARVCDTIVAVDGAFALYPQARPRSAAEQAETVRSVCESAGVGCVVYQPAVPFEENEVGKRNTALALAAAADPDRIVVFDADFHVVALDREVLRGDLAASDLHVATFSIREGEDWMANPATAEAASVASWQTEWRTPDRDIFRWTPDLEYGPTHCAVSGTFDGDVHWLKASRNQAVPESPALDLGRSLVVSHRQSVRPRVRLDAQESYYRRRDAAGVEKLPELELSVA